MKYLIAGKNGQLARAFINRLGEKSADFMAPEKSELDITNAAQIHTVIDSYRPDIIINCAAYNLVDKAEEEYDTALEINATGPGLLASAANRHNALLVHFGSDYVFDGAKKGGLYSEDDAPNPLSAYGQSKLTGEKLVQEEAGRFLIFRVSWVFGEGKNNFIYKLMEWSKKNEVLQIADDEVSIPTYTYTIVDTVLKALDKGMYGLYHLTSNSFCSRYEWACMALKSMGIDKVIKPVSKEIFNLPAKRPGFSAMSNANISGMLDLNIPRWEDDVKLFLREKFSA